jgi:hypothetical protein
MTHESRRRHGQIGFIFFVHVCRYHPARRPASGSADIPHWTGGLPADAPPRRSTPEMS